jgi:hypothetical protein
VAVTHHGKETLMRFNLWKASTLVLAGALAIVTSGDLVREASADAQPHMRTALDHLTKANEALSKANADKGGHRAKAIDLTGKAIEQVKAGIAFDNKH